MARLAGRNFCDDNAACHAKDTIRKRNSDLRRDVPAARSSLPSAALAAEEVRENISQVSHIKSLAVLESGKVETAESSARRIESRTRTRRTELVILRALLVIRQRLVRLVHLLELRIIALVLVRMVLVGKLMKSLLHLILGSRLRHTQSLIIVFICHGIFSV